MGIYIFLFILLFIFGMLLLGNAMDNNDQYYFRKIMLGTAFITISILALLGILYFLILH